MHPDLYKRPLLWCLAALICLLLCFYRPAPAKRDVFHALPQKQVTLTGRVAHFPVHKKKSTNAVVKVLSVNGQPAGGYVYARFAGFEPQWQDTLLLQGRLQKPYGIHLLGSFDWRHYLAQQHIFTEIKVSQAQVVRPAGVFFRGLRALREDILHTFERSFAPELAAIAGGVLLGERGEISPRLYADFQDSGAVHLLVASGGNVGFVTLITVGLCALVGLGRKKTIICALAVAGLYTLAAGADAPLVRAYFMAVCACVGYLLGRNSGVFQGLLVSCFIILCLAPASVFETGFQMSFLATLAIIVCLSNYRLPAAWPGWVRFFAQIFLATLSTQLVLLPIFTNVFYKVSVTGLLSNMLLVPWASALMSITFGYYVFTLLHMGFLLQGPAAWGLEGFKMLVEFFASFKLSSVPAAAWSPGAIAAYYAGLFWLFHLPQKQFARKLFWPCLIVAGMALGVQACFFSGGRVYLLNEWNKNAAIVKLSNGKVLLFEAGIAPEKLTSALYKIGVQKADAVLTFSHAPVPKELETLSKTGTVIRPFTPGVWPGDTLPAAGVPVRVTWGEHQTRQGKMWINAGYSGTRLDDVSYCFASREQDICLGAGARFVRLGENVQANQRNQTVKLQI